MYCNMSILEIFRNAEYLIINSDVVRLNRLAIYNMEMEIKENG